MREDVKQCLKTIDNLQTKINGFEESMQNVIDRSVQNTSLRFILVIFKFFNTENPHRSIV